MWRAALAFSILLLASLAHAQPAQPAPSTPPARPEVGQKVVLKYKAPLRFGATVVEPKEYRLYTIQQVEGDQLLLSAGSVSGWVRADQVVPLDQAIAFYNSEIERAPGQWDAYLYRAFVWDVKHEYDEAIDDFTKSIQLYPYWANTYNNRGWTWHRKEEYDKAIADYNRAIRIDPSCVLAIANRGLAREAKGEYYKAIEDYGRAAKVDPKYARAYAARAWLYATCPDAKFRDGKLAVTWATRACNLTGWKEAIPLNVLAAAYAEAGDFDKAVHWQEKANERYIDLEDRRRGRERLALYKQKEPYRLEEPPGVSAARGPWAGFHDPELARRVFDELEQRLGPPPEGDDPKGRQARDRKALSAIEALSKKYHLKPREIRSIWHAGEATPAGEFSTDRPQPGTTLN